MRSRFSALEFVVVIGMAFGTSLLTSLSDLFADRIAVEGSGAAFGAGHINYIIVYELLMLPSLAAILYVGGWKRSDLPLGASVAATALGLFIGVAMFAADWVFSTILGALSPSIRAVYEIWEAYKPAHPPSLAAVVALSIVNPVFEELFVCGYVIEALRRRFGDTSAANASIVIRAAYHLYQGVAMLAFHIAYGWVQAYVYLRFGRLWPLIVSHAFLDFIALVLLIY